MKKLFSTFVALTASVLISGCSAAQGNSEGYALESEDIKALTEKVDYNFEVPATLPFVPELVDVSYAEMIEDVSIRIFDDQVGTLNIQIIEGPLAGVRGEKVETIETAGGQEVRVTKGDNDLFWEKDDITYAFVYMPGDEALDREALLDIVDRFE